MKNFKENITALLTGEITISKREFVLIAAVCGLAGIVIGLFSAPFTHGIMMGCNNGNGSYDAGGDDTESIGVCECGED